MATIIIPQDTQDLWQGCIKSADAAAWDKLAADLLDSAKLERDARVRDDILTLSMVACCLADDADQAVAFWLVPRDECEEVAA